MSEILYHTNDENASGGAWVLDEDEGRETLLMVPVMVTPQVLRRLRHVQWMMRGRQTDEACAQMLGRLLSIEALLGDLVDMYICVVRRQVNENDK